METSNFEFFMYLTRTYETLLNMCVRAPKIHAQMCYSGLDLAPHYQLALELVISSQDFLNIFTSCLDKLAAGVNSIPA